MQDTRGSYDRRTFLKLSGAAATIAACDLAATPTAAPVSTSAAATPAARPTGRIAVYSALDESTNKQLIAAFKAANAGTAVDLLPLAAAGELQTRIRVEKVSPKADLFIGGDSSLHEGLGREGLLARYASPNSSAIAAEAQDANGYWTGWYFGILGFVSNTERLTREVGGTQPKTWDDLLDPAWKGKIVLPDPLKTGAGYIFLATQVFRFHRDEDKAMDFMKKLHPQIARYVARTAQGIELVSQGQFVGGPNWGHDILTAKARHPGIELTMPENTGLEIGAVSIIGGSKNLPVAKAFVDWILTKEAGELSVRLSNRVSTRKDVPVAPGAPTLDQVKLVDHDRPWANEHKDRLIRKWQTTIGI